MLLRTLPSFLCVYLVFLLRASVVDARGKKVGRHQIQHLGAQGVNLWRLDNIWTSEAGEAYTRPGSNLVVQQPGEFLFDSELSGFRGYWFRQPLDHFSNSSRTFRQRYWINARHYVPHSGGPVIVLDGGETSGEDRIPFLDTGIVEILAKATGGLGVVLEHRYYGRSVPVSNFSTDSLRWLNNAQSAADSANFMSTIKFPGIEEDLTAPNTPWIYYGGSYAGARAAHMRILYPELVFGAIASSAVTHASIENWQYTDIIRRAADPRCSAHLEHSIGVIDVLLKVPHLKKHLKALFGLEELEHDDDFASLIESPLGAWQAKNWDPEVGSTEFDEFCDALDEPIQKHDMDMLNKTVMYDHETRSLSFTNGLEVNLAVLNYGKYIKENYVSACPEGQTIEQCFGTHNDTKFQEIDTKQEWRLWMFQVCTEWGYFGTAPPAHFPRIVSKLLTLDYASKICRQAFPPGEHFTVPPLPNVTVVNELGDFGIAADRLAIIDGEVDPWRPCTPHSECAEDREDTILRPFKLIPNGVHHYDEFGLRDINDEPPEILQIHEEMVDFVQEWLKDWKPKATT